MLQNIIYFMLLQVGTRNPAATLWVVDVSHPSQLKQMDLKLSPLLKHDSQAEW
jgi:hypothetical protein